MSDTAHVGKKIRSFESAPQFDGYSRVVITVSEDVEYSAGTKTGRTLTLECPWGTQDMANNLLASIRGFQYQPYTATDAHLDPAAELGDGVNVHNEYGGIYTRKTTFGQMCLSTVSAPSEEELDHEYPYISKQERRVTRKLNNMTAELKVQAGLISAEVTAREEGIKELTAKLSVQADLISAKVSKTGGDGSSFGWELDDSSWTVKSGGSTVFKIDKDGATVKGKITATSGEIGGFTIKKQYLSYNGHTWTGTNTDGIYIGVNGIRLGTKFKVDRSGNLTASSGKFTGTVYAGKIKYGTDEDGTDYGTLSGSALTRGSVSGGKSGAIGNGALSTYNFAGGINTSLGYANFSNDVFNGDDDADQMSILGTFKFQNHTVNRRFQRVMGADGSTIELSYLAWG